MNRERISEALNGIAAEYIAECESYVPRPRQLPSEQERKMGRYEQISKPSSRKVIALILAACLMIALGITAYATGLIPSVISKWVHGFNYETPTDELREARPDYAEWLDEQLETQAILAEMAEKAQTVNEEKKPAGLPDASITLLESYYDGEKLTLACRYDAPQWPVTFDFDRNHPLFSELKEPEEGYWSGYEDWTNYVHSEDEQRQIRQKLQDNGSVGFSVYDFFISDHVLLNEEDPGFSHTDPADNDGIFYVDPFHTTAFGSEFPESCKNLPQIDVTFTVRCAVTHYWLEGDSVRWAYGERMDYPVSFTIMNINN